MTMESAGVVATAPAQVVLWARLNPATWGFEPRTTGLAGGSTSVVKKRGRGDVHRRSSGIYIGGWHPNKKQLVIRGNHGCSIQFKELAQWHLQASVRHW